MLETRSIAKAVIFSIITLGIYSIYWFIKITNEVHEVSGDPKTASGGLAFLFLIVTFGLYGIYWVYRISTELEGAIEDREMRCSNLSVITLILFIFGLGIISYALIQDSLNDVIKHDQETERHIQDLVPAEA